MTTRTKRYATAEERDRQIAAIDAAIGYPRRGTQRGRPFGRETPPGPGEDLDGWTLSACERVDDTTIAVREERLVLDGRQEGETTIDLSDTRDRDDEEERSR